MEVNWIIGVFFVILSILVLIFPNVIAGYSTLSNEEKEKINKRKLAVFAFKIFFSIGVLVVIGGYIFLGLGVPYLNYIFHPVLFILMLIIFYANSKLMLQ